MNIVIVTVVQEYLMADGPPDRRPRGLRGPYKSYVLKGSLAPIPERTARRLDEEVRVYFNPTGAISLVLLL